MKFWDVLSRHHDNKKGNILEGNVYFFANF